jgi:hypothetical protein
VLPGHAPRPPDDQLLFPYLNQVNVSTFCRRIKLADVTGLKRKANVRGLASPVRIDDERETFGRKSSDDDLFGGGKRGEQLRPVEVEPLKGLPLCAG